MSDNKGSTSSHSASKKSNKKKHKKESLYKKYIKTPLLFLLMALIPLVPLSTVLFSQAVKAVHRMQETLVIDYSEIEVSDKYYEACKKDNRALVQEELYACNKVGVLTCKECAINTPVYYGINRVSLRSGAGLSYHSALPGAGKEISVAGNASTCFKALYNVKEGDTFVFETAGGSYHYTVMETYVATEEKADFAGEYLVLSAPAEAKAFACFGEEKLYVVAAPAVGEVTA